MTHDGFLTFPEYLSLMDTEVPGEVDEQWTKHWEKVLSEMLAEAMLSGHGGDCTKIACTCELCFLEMKLNEYRMYRFNLDKDDWRRDGGEWKVYLDKERVKGK